MKPKFVLMLLALFSSMIFLNGCISPLKSDDPIERMEALNEIEDETELFLIAMNLRMVVSKCSGSYCDAFLESESYHDDVRVGAVKKIKSPVFLIRCVVWSDGEMYHYGESEKNEFCYKGRKYWLRDAETRMRQRIRPGDCVRAAALNKLSDPSIFASVVHRLRLFDVENESKSHLKKRELGVFKEFLSADGVAIDSYVRLGNSVDCVFEELINKQVDQSLICAFVSASVANGLSVYPEAMCRAIEKINGTDQRSAIRVFEALSVAAKESLLHKEKKMIAKWMWQIFNVIDNPTLEMQLLCVKIGYGHAESICMSDRECINRIAKSKIRSNIWARCYLENYFDGYSRESIIENITDESSALSILIGANKISPLHVDRLIPKITTTEGLKRIKKDCYLKIVADKADLAIFNKNYISLLEEVEQTENVIQRAILAKTYVDKLKNSTVSKRQKLQLDEKMGKYIQLGIQALEENVASQDRSRFSVKGFYVGMPKDHARFLYDVKYANEQITWVVDATGVITQLNFGSSLLGKIFRYDASTYQEWIKCLSVNKRRHFDYSVLRDEKRPIGGRWTVVRVAQDIWRCTDFQSDITITYFGKKNVEEISPKESGFVERVFKIARGVTLGDVVKEVVLEGSRHWANEEWDRVIGGVPGMLRIEKGAMIGKNENSKTGKTSLDRTMDSATDSINAIKGAAPAIENFLNNVFK